MVLVLLGAFGLQLPVPDIDEILLAADDTQLVLPPQVAKEEGCLAPRSSSIDTLRVWLYARVHPSGHRPLQRVAGEQRIRPGLTTE